MSGVVRQVGCLLAVIVAAAALLNAPAQAQAHVPVLEPRGPSEATPADDGALGSREIKAPNESRAIYGTLTRDELLDSYRFTTEDAIATTVDLLLPAASGSARKVLPLRLTIVDLEENSATAVESAPRSTFFEPFSLERFDVVARASYEFKAGRTYVLAVAPGGSRGARPGRAPYVIAFSGAERFTPSDWLSSAGSVPRIWLGLYGQWAPRWGMIGGAFATAAIAGLLIGRHVSMRRRERRSAAARAPSQ